MRSYLQHRQAGFSACLSEDQHSTRWLAGASHRLQCLTVFPNGQDAPQGRVFGVGSQEGFHNPRFQVLDSRTVGGLEGRDVLGSNARLQDGYHHGTDPE